MYFRQPICEDLLLTQTKLYFVTMTASVAVYTSVNWLNESTKLTVSTRQLSNQIDS